MADTIDDTTNEIDNEDLDLTDLRMARGCAAVLVGVYERLAADMNEVRSNLDAQVANLDHRGIYGDWGHWTTRAFHSLTAASDLHNHATDNIGELLESLQSWWDHAQLGGDGKDGSKGDADDPQLDLPLN